MEQLVELVDLGRDGQVNGLVTELNNQTTEDGGVDLYRAISPSQYNCHSHVLFYVIVHFCSSVGVAAYLVGDDEGLLGSDEGRLGEETLDLGNILGIQLLLVAKAFAS